MKILKRVITLSLVLCMLLTTAIPAHAMSLQEQSWLSLLRPKLPKLEGSYPARLLVTLPSTETVTLNGTCGVGGTVTDEQLVDILKRACSSVEGYKDPQNAVDDMVLVAAIKEKLKFTEEDMQQLKDNFLELSGFDQVADLLNLTMPDVEGNDIASIAAEIVQEGKPGLGFLNPIPDSLGGFASGLIINGVFVTWEEFQRDKEKYKDIVNMSQANARLRQYYGRVDELLRDAMSDSTAWAIRIYDQQVTELLFDHAENYRAPLIVSADIELVKDDGSYGNIGGTYAGRFKVDADADLADYDRNYHHRMAERYNGPDGGKAMIAASGGRGTAWSGTSITINRPSEYKIVLESTQTSVNLALPSGVNRTIFELPLDTTALDATLSYITDLVSEVQHRATCGCTVTKTYTLIQDGDVETWRYYHITHESSDGVCIAAKYEPGHTISRYGEPYELNEPQEDIRPYVQMTLVVDML